jgi:hypothetical protein
MTAPGGAVVFPPRLFGTAPDDRTVDEVVAVFQTLFGAPPGEPDATAVEEAEDLEPYLAEAGRRHPVRPSAVRVERLRFLDDDSADVEFVIHLHGGPGFPFSGRAVRRDDQWLVSRDTVARVLQRAGVVVAPRPPTQ